MSPKSIFCVLLRRAARLGGSPPGACAVRRHRCRLHRATGAAGAGARAAGRDRQEPTESGPGRIRRYDRQSWHAAAFERHGAQLPADELVAAVAGHDRFLGSYPALARACQDPREYQRHLDPGTDRALSPTSRRAQRRSPIAGAAAGDCTHTHSPTGSDRFASLQQLIGAIGTAADQKASLDLNGANRSRAGHAAERADQAPGALPGRAVPGVGPVQQRARAGDCGSGISATLACAMGL